MKTTQAAATRIVRTYQHGIRAYTTVRYVTVPTIPVSRKPVIDREAYKRAMMFR